MFIIGNTTNPEEVENVFMFLDLKGATSMLEKDERQIVLLNAKKIYY